MVETRTPDPASMENSEGQESRRLYLAELAIAERSVLRSQQLIEEQQERLDQQSEANGAVSPHSVRLMALLEACQEMFINRMVAIRCDLELGRYFISARRTFRQTTLPPQV
jgi:hypothetical protein